MTSTAELVRRSLYVEVNLELEEADEEPLQALADANQLQQVLVNLALNARDALTRPEPIIFRMRQRVLTRELPAFPESVRPGDYVVLEIRDHGKGMSQDVLNQALDNETDTNFSKLLAENLAAVAERLEPIEAARVCGVSSP